MLGVSPKLADPTRPDAPASAGPLRTGHRLAIIVDPRFSGGTCSAVAQEIRTVANRVDLSVFAIETAMFSGRGINPALRAALDDHGIGIDWNPPVIRADTVVFHNPSCLRLNTHFPGRISCHQAYVVTHENFVRPNGSESFDVATCLGLIDRALICRYRRLAPVSMANRRGLEEWLRLNRENWAIAPFDWINICDLEITPPTGRPRDRRGRHSRAGFEKFPPLGTMLQLFPPHADRCVILGGNNLLLDPQSVPRHWEVLRFGETDVTRFLADIDFFVYFTHPLWRESFGRVIPEAIAAGKLVITDPETAEAFGEAVVAAHAGDVDRIVQEFVANPHRYVDFVRTAQNTLARFSPAAFVQGVLGKVGFEEGANALL